MGYYPLPNQPGDPVTGRNNYFATGSVELDINNFDLRRRPATFRHRQRVSARYSYRNTQDDAATAVFPRRHRDRRGARHRGEPRPQLRRPSTPTRSSLDTLLTARLGFARTLFVYNNQGLGFKPSSLGLPASIDATVDRQMFPRFGASGFVTLGGNDHRYNAFMSYPLLGGLHARRATKHTLKTGFDGRMLRVNVWEARAAGTFNFSAGMTQGPNPNTASSTAGHCDRVPAARHGHHQQRADPELEERRLAELLSCAATRRTTGASTQQADAEPRPALRLRHATHRAIRSHELLRPGRAIAAGRPRQRHSRISRGGLVFVGVDGNSRSQFVADTNNIAPRLGAAYHLTTRPWCAAGYAHVYGPSAQAAQGTIGPFGFRTENLWVSTVDGITPYNLLRNPYPAGFVPSPGAADGSAHRRRRRHSGVLRDRHPDAVEPAVERHASARDAMGHDVEIAYVGTRGYDLQHQRRERPEPQSARSAATWRSAHSSISRSTIPSSASSTTACWRRSGEPRAVAAAVPAVHRRHPALPLGSTTSYHALQISWNKRMSARAPDRGFVCVFQGDGDRREPSGQLRHRREQRRSPATTFRIVLYAACCTSCRSAAAAASGSGCSPVDAVLGGWQINGIVTVQSGPPPRSLRATRRASSAPSPARTGMATIPCSRGSSRIGCSAGSTRRFQPACGVHVRQHRRDLRPSSRRRRAEPRSVAVQALRALGRVGCRRGVEAFNALNRVQFSAPNTSVTSGSFGIVSSQANTPRQLQFGVKVLW